MRLEWLEDILLIAETGSLSAAAERRRLTQSAFSRRIQKVEDLIGVQLLDRSRKPVRLRPTVLDHQDQIARIVSQLRQLTADLRSGDRAQSGRVVLASQHALTTGFTPRLIRQLDSFGREVFVRLRSANHGDCIALLLARQADIALIYQQPSETRPLPAEVLQARTIGQDTLRPVCHPAHVPTGGSLPIIAYPADVFLGEVMERTIQPKLHGEVTTVARVETALTLAALSLAEAGIGVAWLPDTLVSGPIADGRVIDLSDRLPTCRLDIVAIRLLGHAGEAGQTIWRDLFRVVEERDEAASR